MTAIHLHRSHGLGRRHSLRYRVNDAVQRGLAILHTWMRRTHERHELAGLDERMLQDIGITRADALYLSSKPFWKE